MTAVEVHSLKKVFIPYGGLPWQKDVYTTTALRDVSFTLAAGKTMGIMGMNGSGKSTLLRIIAGILQPSAGSVKVSGDVAAAINMAACFHDDLTVIDNIALYSELSGSGKYLRQRTKDIIHFAGLEHVQMRPIREFSRGMKVRLAFSAVTHVPADIYIFDEAFSGGDGKFRPRALARIKQLQRESKTLLLASHQPQFLKQLASEGLVLDQGKRVMSGTFEQAAATYQTILET